MTRRLIVPAALVLVAIDLAAATPKFTSSWKAPEAVGVRFVGQKVAALVITSDLHLQMSAEEQLARELGTRGMEGVATYRLAPKEELTNTERARFWFDRAHIQGVVALRPISIDTVRTYTPTIWTTSSYSTLWGYYGYGQIGLYSPGSMQQDTTLVVETLIYSVPLDKLLWAGVSTTTNPRDAPAFIKALVGAAVKEMRKQGLAQ